MEKALEQARAGRRHILAKMLEVLPEPRKELNPFAPRIEMITISPDKIRDVIGSGGKVIKEIVATTGCKIDINDNGQVFIASADGAAMERAIKWIRELTAEAELGQVYTGKVTRVEEYGAFVEILPGKDGLVHVSELEPRRVERVTDVCNVGDELVVKVIGIDEKGKVRLSRKQALYPDAGPTAGGGVGERAGRDRDRGGRDRERERGGRDRGERGGRERERGGRDRDRSRSGGRDRGGASRQGHPAAPQAPHGTAQPDLDHDDVFERLDHPAGEVGGAYSDEVDDELRG
jgi:polyribonucleotide nucleotidyltransferase